MRICIRNGYTIPDGSLWCDTIDLLRHFGKDIRQPKYVCPTDLKALHDKLAAKRQEQLQRERTAEEREQAIKDEKQFLQEKGMLPLASSFAPRPFERARWLSAWRRFFGLVFADELISVKVIESVEEMILEGKAMHHCVGTYYKRADSLILSATIDGKRIETPPKEMELLYHLASSPNRVFTRNQLLDEVWGFDYFGDSRTVDVHVKRLREKLEGVSNQWSLKTVWGVGYKFEVL